MYLHGQGDYVRAGDPVLRVEGPEFVYLVGPVKYRGMLRIGTKLARQHHAVRGGRGRSHNRVR